MSTEEALYPKSNFEYTSITTILPSDPLKKHRSVETLTASGLRFPCVFLIYSPGNNIGNLHFLLKVPEECDPAVVFEPVIENVKLITPYYHTRAMRAALFEKFGRISPCTKPSALRYFYRELTGDQCSALITQEAEVDKRIKQIMNPSILSDLRALNTGHASKFNTFWEECGKFLNENVGIAVDDRHHGEITRLATAILVRDPVDQAKARCPEGTEIPNIEWTRLQFWPKIPAAKSSLHYTGQFCKKFMVQQRQWRHSHIGAHYAAEIFCYMREYALELREYCAFACLDDKHKLKVGEPNCPVAAAERGRQVPVCANQFLTVADHDYTKFGLVPSIVIVTDIPE